MINNLQQTKDALDKAIDQRKLTQAIIKSLGPSIVETLQPVLQQLADNSRITKEDILAALASIEIPIPKVDVPQAEVKVTIPEIKVPEPKVTVNVPEIRMPEVKIPEIKIPPIKVPTPEVTVNVPPFPKIPDLKWPDDEMPVRGWVQLMGVDLNHPLPVQLRDAKGNPVSLFENLTQIVSGGGGGGFQYITVKDIQRSGVSIISDTEGALKVTGGLSVSGFSSSVGASILNGDGNSLDPRDRNWTITETVPISAGSTLDVKQLSGSIDSVNIVSPINQGDAATAVRVVIAGNSDVSVTATQTGTWNIGTVTTVTGVTNSLAASIVDSTGIQYSGSNPLPITGTVTVANSNNTLAVNVVDSTGIAFEGANAFPITIVTGTNVTVATANVDSTGIQFSGSNPFPITLATGSSVSVAATIIDSTGIGYSGSNPIPINLVSQSLASSASALVDSTGIQYSGSNPVPITWVSGAGATVGAANIDSTGIQYSGSNPFPIYVAGTATATTSVNVVDSGGIVYSGSNPVPITIVSGALTSVISVGDTLHDAVDIGAAPLKTGGVAMQTNPTAVADGDRVNFRGDDLGRQLVRPFQARDLTLTAYATLSNGTETTLLSASAGSYHDLIYIMCANTSNAAVQVDVRAVTAGNIVMTIVAPASGTAGVAAPLPIKSADTGNNWTVDMPDYTNTSVYVTAEFIREV